MTPGNGNQPKELVTEPQDEHHAQQEVDMAEKANEASLDQSLLPYVESNYVNHMDETGDEFEFLDSNRLDSAIGNLGGGVSNTPANDQMNADQATSLVLDTSNNEEIQIQDGPLDNLVDLDTQELYKDIASLDLTTLKDSPVYTEEPIDELQNPDPVMPTNLDNGESDDDDDQPETLPLETALKSREQDGEVFVMASSALQVDEDPGDPICSISIPPHKAPEHNHNHQHYHNHENQKDSGHICQDHTSIRLEAWNAAQSVFKTFGLVENSSIDEQRCEGHKETIFGVGFSECGFFCATASQDSTIKIWDVPSNKLLASLEGHSPEFECLRVAWAPFSWSSNILDRTSKFRYLLASSGADGTVRLWACRDPRIPLGEEGGWQCYLMLDHSRFGAKRSTFVENQDKPQIYTLQFINHWDAFDTFGEETPNAFLMTSSDDYLHFWTLNGLDQGMHLDEPACPDRLSMKEVTSLHFGSIRQYGYGVSVVNVTDPDHNSNTTHLNGGNTNGDSPETIFGGDRNPNNVVYVFDASFCSANGLVGVALSDGTLRLINGRGICVCILNVPSSQSHLTSCTWDRHGSRLITTVATGQLVSWKLRPKDDETSGGYTKADHVCTFEGGHQAGRPLFGARYYGGETEGLILSWSVDGSLCLWDSKSEGHAKSPMAVLRQYGPSPLYAVEVHSNQSIAVGGADSECGSHGVPLYLYKSQDRTSDGEMDDLD